MSMFFFSDGKRLLLVYQSEWQAKMMKRYGEEMLLLDATYRTTRYTLPLFFLAVPTNVDYQVVAAFVVQDEDTESIQEALMLIKAWNQDFQPKFAMTDYCLAEINALEDVWTGE